MNRAYLSRGLCARFRRMPVYTHSLNTEMPSVSFPYSTSSRTGPYDHSNTVFRDGHTFTGGSRSSEAEDDESGFLGRPTDTQRTSAVVRAIVKAMAAGGETEATIKKEVPSILKKLQSDGKFKTVKEDDVKEILSKREFKTHLKSYPNKEESEKIYKNLKKDGRNVSVDEVANRIYAEWASRGAKRIAEGKNGKGRRNSTASEGSVASRTSTRSNKSDKKNNKKKDGDDKKKKDKKKKNKKPKQSAQIREMDRLGKIVDSVSAPVGEESKKENKKKRKGKKGKRRSLLSILLGLVQRDRFSSTTHRSPVGLQHLNVERGLFGLELGGVNYKSRLAAVKAYFENISDSLVGIVSTHGSLNEKRVILEVIDSLDIGVRLIFEGQLDRSVRTNYARNIATLENAETGLQMEQPYNLKSSFSIPAIAGVDTFDFRIWATKLKYKLGLKGYSIDKLNTVQWDHVYANVKKELLNTNGISELSKEKDFEAVLGQVFMQSMATALASKAVDYFGVVYGMLADVLTILHVRRRDILLSNCIKVFLSIWNTNEIKSEQLDKQVVDFITQLDKAFQADARISMKTMTTQAIAAKLNEDLKLGGGGKISVIDVLEDRDVSRKLDVAIDASLRKISELFIPTDTKELSEIVKPFPGSIEVLSKPTRSDSFSKLFKLIQPIFLKEMKGVEDKFFPSVFDEISLRLVLGLYERRFLSRRNDIANYMNVKALGSPIDVGVLNEQGLLVWPVSGENYNIFGDAYSKRFAKECGVWFEPIDGKFKVTMSVEALLQQVVSKINRETYQEWVDLRPKSSDMYKNLLTYIGPQVSKKAVEQITKIAPIYQFNRVSKDADEMVAEQQESEVVNEPRDPGNALSPVDQIKSAVEEVAKWVALTTQSVETAAANPSHDTVSIAGQQIHDTTQLISKYIPIFSQNQEAVAVISGYRNQLGSLSTRLQAITEQLQFESAGAAAAPSAETETAEAEMLDAVQRTTGATAAGNKRVLAPDEQDIAAFNKSMDEDNLEGAQFVIDEVKAQIEGLEKRKKEHAIGNGAKPLPKVDKMIRKLGDLLPGMEKRLRDYQSAKLLPGSVQQVS